MIGYGSVGEEDPAIFNDNYILRDVLDTIVDLGI